MEIPPTVSTAPPENPGAEPLYRSGAVARMVQMPVATLRIWERRYQAVAPTTSGSGHRLYNAADVERVAVLRQLTACGHAIGSIAALPLAQLREVYEQHYGSSGWVKIEDAEPAHKLDATALKDSNLLEIRVFGNDEMFQAVVLARLDNLGKGASGAAVQNLQLMLGV